MASNASSSRSSSASLPPMTTRQKARRVAQAKQPRLKYVRFPSILDDTRRQSMEIKESFRGRFDDLCEEAGWAPTDAIRNELMILTKVDTVNGWVLLGRKRFEEGVLCVWYRPVYSVRGRSIEFRYGSEKTVFKPEELRDRVDKDKVWLPFTKLFDLTNLSRDPQNLYLTGVYEILRRFTYMRGIPDPNGSDDSVLRPGRVELPFLPGSGWLRQQGVLLVANPPDDQNTAVGLCSRLQSASSAELNADTHVDSDGAYQSGDTTSSTSTTSSIDELQSHPPSVVDGTDPTGSVSSRDSSSTELEKMRRQKRKATSTPDGLPTRKQGRLRRIGSETVSSFVATKPGGLPTRTHGRLPRIGSETVSSSVTTKHSAEDLYRSHCQEYQWTPSEATLQTIVDLLGAHGVEVGSLEASLLAFVQYVGFVWENDRIFVGSRKAEGAQRYERVWYKRVHRDGIYHGEFSVDAGRQTCSLSVEHARVEYFWPLFDTLFDMQDLARANNKHGDVYIAGTYLMLLQYPELRRFQKRSSGTGIQLEDRPEGFKRPFSPESSQSGAISQAEQASSFDEPVSARGLRPAPSVQCRQSDGGARTLAEVLQEQETQRKITTMIQESARAYIADPEPTINFDASARIPLTVENTPAFPQQPQGQDVVGGVLEHLLQSVQVSSFANSTSHGLQLQMVASLPAHLFRPQILELCPVVSSEVSPKLPPRDCIVRELETIAMGSSMPQQSAAHQKHVLPSQERHLPAPVALMVRAPQKPSSSSITVNQARELLRRPRAKLISSGEDQDGGLQLFRFCINFPLTATPTEKAAIEFKFSAILSVDTSPVSLTKSQAFKALSEFAREDEESQQAV